MIVLFTDFGLRDPYVGQVKARLADAAPAHPVVDLLHDVPAFDAYAGAHLLAAFAPGFPPGSVFLCVVDPGVGTSRAAVVVFAGGRWFVGPDNGLLSVVAGRNADARVWRIVWKPAVLSASFHGRDLFAPIAAAVAAGEFPTDKLEPAERLDVAFDAGDVPRILYIDHYGNAWTGLRSLARDAIVRAGGRAFRHSESFGFVGKGEGFWFVNSVGLVELAVNRGSAAETFGLGVGDRVDIGRLE